MIADSISYSKFRFGIVEDPEILKFTLKLRYETMVTETGFARPEDYPDGLEKDVYDNSSLHFACIDEHGEVVATIRLILYSENGFPLEKEHSTIRFNESPSDKNKFCEISRLTVSKNLRRRRDDGLYGVESYLAKRHGGSLPDSGNEAKFLRRRRKPIIVLGLYQIVLQECKRRNLEYLYMSTYDRVYYALKKFGFSFQKIGASGKYDTPYKATTVEIEEALLKNNPELLSLMYTGLEKKYWPDFYKNSKDTANRRFSRNLLDRFKNISKTIKILKIK